MRIEHLIFDPRVTDGQPVILDEIQYAPLLLSYIKSAIHEERSPGRWLLTGSQHFGLMAGVSQSLAGRVAVLTLLPFSPGEAAGLPAGELSIDELLNRVFGVHTGGRGFPGISCETPAGLDVAGIAV